MTQKGPKTLRKFSASIRSYLRSTLCELWDPLWSLSEFYPAVQMFMALRPSEKKAQQGYKRVHEQ